MTGAVNRDYDDILRRVLHAAAESVEPSADGLERIRERLGRPPLLSFSSVAGWYSVAAVRFTGWAVPAFGTACEIFWALVDRFRPLDTPPGHAKPGMRWLRPVTATAMAIFLVSAGAFAAMAIPRITAQNASDAGGATGSNGSGGGAGNLAGKGSTKLPSHSGSAGLTGTASPTTSVASKCHATSSTTPTIMPTASTSPPASTSTSPTPTPTSTSPSPSPTSTSPSPTSSGTSPTEPSSGTTGTAAASEGTTSSATTGSGSVSPGAPSTSAVPTGGNSPAGQGQTAGPVGASGSHVPCVSSTPTSAAPRNLSQSRTQGLGPASLVLSGRSGRLVLPNGRGSETF
jgi:hypothetical protein